MDYITKPISKSIVMARVATHLALYNQQKECALEVVKKTAMYEDSQNDKRNEQIPGRSSRMDAPW